MKKTVFAIACPDFCRECILIKIVHKENAKLIKSGTELPLKDVLKTDTSSFEIIDKDSR